MDPDFWHSRWQDGRIGFHQDRPTPLLVEFWPSLGVAGGRVFVPLCGKSLDMAWLAAQGHRVLGVELSATAVRAFFDEHGLVPSIEPNATGERYRAGVVDVVRGDAFALDADALADCTGVFDRGALIALPPPMRERYAREVYARLPTGCRGLLVTLEYPQHEKQGPPFSVPEAEVRALFGPDWQVDVLVRRDILAAQPGFTAEGVTALDTVAYRLERR
ncbi:MAG TPA: thiopurine S-methyltransferase [Lysobacter sp.]